MLSKVEDIKLDKYVIKDKEKDEKVLAIISGKLRKNNKLKVGDIVDVKYENNNYIIHSLRSRKNDFARPPVANIDYMYITVSVKEPSPDLLLLDKQLVTAMSKNVIPIIIINKIDLVDVNENVARQISDIYTNIGYKVILVSSKEKEGILKMLDIEEGKTVAFSGSSGVGKSSLMKNIITEEDFQEIIVGDISKKMEKGTHTTKHIRLYETKNNEGKEIYFLDTPGFSSYEVFDIKSKNLKLYYPEFSNVICEYQDCNHINEGMQECVVKREIESGLIDKGRYERYVRIFNEIKQKEKNKYK